MNAKMSIIMAHFTQNRDILKMKKALDNSTSVIRLLQTDVLYDKIDWKNKLIGAIKKYDIPSIIYVDDNGQYDIYKEKYK